MKNFTMRNSTIVGTIPENTPFTKASEFVGEYAKGDLQVLGFLRTHSEKFNKDQYSLFIKKKKTHMLMNVPGWYGEQLEDDFVDEGSNAEEYFKDAFISSITEFDTKYGNKSINIEIY